MDARRAFWTFWVLRRRESERLTSSCCPKHLFIPPKDLSTKQPLSVLVHTWLPWVPQKNNQWDIHTPNGRSKRKLCLEYSHPCVISTGLQLYYETNSCSVQFEPWLKNKSPNAKRPAKESTGKQIQTRDFAPKAKGQRCRHRHAQRGGVAHHGGGILLFKSVRIQRCKCKRLSWKWSDKTWVSQFVWRWTIETLPRNITLDKQKSSMSVGGGTFHVGVAYSWGVDIGPSLVDGLQGVASIGRGRGKSKVWSSLNPGLLQYYFAPFFKGSEVFRRAALYHAWDGLVLNFCTAVECHTPPTHLKQIKSTQDSFVWWKFYFRETYHSCGIVLASVT